MKHLGVRKRNETEPEKARLVWDEDGNVFDRDAPDGQRKQRLAEQAQEPVSKKRLSRKRSINWLERTEIGKGRRPANT